jgi:dolichol-phosphate mannosyltransferase
MMLSVVIPVFNEERNLTELVSRLRAVLEASIDFEIVFVNDGSTDGTFELLRELYEQDKRIKSIHLARNFGHQAAISAGLRAATGDAVVTMDGDFPDAPEVIPDFMQRWRDGYEVVYAVRASRQEHWIKLLAYKAFYRALTLVSEINIPLDSGDFSLMDRRVVDVLNSMPERARFVRGMRSWVGFRQIGVDVPRDARYAGQPKYTFRRLLRLALDGFFSFSYRPLQLASLLGLGVSALAMLLAVALIGIKLFHGVAVPGWTSLMVAVLLLGGVQLISLGILGEYVGRTHDEARARPMYIIASVMGETQLPPQTELPPFPPPRERPAPDR